MGRRGRAEKRKKSSGSDGANTQTKSARNGGSPLNSGNSVSDSIHQANSVLYGADTDLNNSVFDNTTDPTMSESTIV